MTGCPSTGASRSPTMRARISAVPPAPDETRICTGLVGQLCALAKVGASKARNANSVFRILIRVHPSL
jgi:hypothetical protein